MSHSHPRTFKYLNNICKKNNVILSSLEVEDSFYDLSVQIHLQYTDFGRVLLHILIPIDLNDKGNNVIRLANCFKFWLPYSLEILSIKQEAFSLSLNASDWGNEKFLSMVGTNPNNIIPDEYAMFEGQLILDKISWNDLTSFEFDWAQRKNLMFWRGSTTGKPITSSNTLRQLLRVDTCLKYNSYKCFDIKISRIVQNKIPKQIIRQFLQSNHILSSRVRESKFSEYKYYPDLPGNNETCGSWGTIKKHLRGNLVFKPNYSSQLFYERFMQPWQHFIPVKTDFSDLHYQFSWAEQNSLEASKIAWNGYNIANKYLRNIKDHFIETSLKSFL